MILPTAKLGFIPEVILAGGAGSWGWILRDSVGMGTEEVWRKKGLHYADGRLAGYSRGPVGSVRLHPLSFSQSTCESNYSLSRMGAPGMWARARTCFIPAMVTSLLKEKI